MVILFAYGVARLEPALFGNAGDWFRFAAGTT